MNTRKKKEGQRSITVIEFPIGVAGHTAQSHTHTHSVCWPAKHGVKEYNRHTCSSLPWPSSRADSLLLARVAPMEQRTRRRTDRQPAKNENAHSNFLVRPWLQRIRRTGGWSNASTVRERERLDCTAQLACPSRE